MNMNHSERPPNKASIKLVLAVLLIGVAILAGVVWKVSSIGTAVVTNPERSSLPGFDPRQPVDTSGYSTVSMFIVPWDPTATLMEISNAFQGVGKRGIRRVDEELGGPHVSDDQRALMLLTKASLWNYEGEPKRAYQVLEQARSLVEKNEAVARAGLYSIVAFQGITALRRGENENCIMCRGESSCILPISPAAVHTNPDGSRRAIQHFTEYLEQFPDDLEIRWLLNLAHMTLGEYPDRVDPRFLVRLDHFLKSECDIGKFRDVGHLVGVNCFNQAGGAVMEDFDNDGLLDIVRTTFDPAGPMVLFRNNGQGRFEERAREAGVEGQLGGLNCMQTDYNNDGYMDVFIVRGAWLSNAMRPTLLRNNQNGSFTDVTEEAGLLHPVNSIAASWRDYDNDGWLDVFVCCERQPSRLYRNLANGTFEDVSLEAGLHQPKTGAKGAAWIDYDNDGFEDLFVNYLVRQDGAQLFHNKGDGTFEDVTATQGIDGPVMGFSCWAWDYDNDGWLDIFATCYQRTLGDVIKGLQGEPHHLNSNRLYRNRQGQGFEDVTKEAGLDMVFSTMGSNYGDFDNDGFLDMYLGTGEPDLSTLVPNRMFKNMAGRRFAEITASSGTGNLQKGHGVACGDWDRDGNTDIFIEMGGAVPGDKYHNILFQNPGHANNWLTVKLIGQETNRAAIGARIKVVTAGDEPRTIHRHISSGSSFGANPLQQTIGLGKTDRIALLEIQWPKSKKSQVFRDIATNQAIEITEFAKDYRGLNWKALPSPILN